MLAVALLALAAILTIAGTALLNVPAALIVAGLWCAVVGYDLLQPDGPAS